MPFYKTLCGQICNQKIWKCGKKWQILEKVNFSGKFFARIFTRKNFVRKLPRKKGTIKKYSLCQQFRKRHILPIFFTSFKICLCACICAFYPWVTKFGSSFSQSQILYKKSPFPNFLFTIRSFSKSFTRAAPFFRFYKRMPFILRQILWKS